MFLADSFTTFTEPAIGRAAIELLEAAGWSVRLESGGCCGRSSISKGLLDRARGMAEDMTERLAPYAERGVPIVGCEPSCLLTLREEHLQLQPGNPRAEAVASQAKLVEELLVEAIDDGSLKLDPGSRVAGSRIVFHGHCHQKALAGTKATVELLRRIPGAEVVELDAGCCGMAGSFGFEAEHYELSMQIGELTAVPGVARRGRRHSGRRDRGLMPSADRARSGSGGPPSGADREGGAVSDRRGSHVQRTHLNTRPRRRSSCSARRCRSTWACSASSPRSCSARPWGCRRTTSSPASRATCS